MSRRPSVPSRMRRRVGFAAMLLLFALPATSALAASGDPVLTGSVSDPVNLSGATSTAVSGNFAYVTSYSMGQITAVNISNPAAPVIAGSTGFRTSLLNASTINIVGNFAYVASKNRNASKTSNDDGTGNSLTIVDISNPGSPTVVGSVTDATRLFGAYGIAVQGSFAYVAAQGCLAGQPCPNASVGNSFDVVNISNPSAPAIVATLHNSALPAPWAGSNALDHADSVFIAGNFAYVTASYSNRFTAIDISTPTSPKIVASLSTAGLVFPTDVAVQGTDAYIADQVGANTAGFTVVDVSNPSSPKLVGSVKNALLSGAYRVRVHGDFAYVSASSGHAIAMIDISDPTHPRFLFGLNDATHLWHTTGLDLNASLTSLIATSPFNSTQGNVLFPPFPNQPGGPKQTGTASAISLIPNPIAVAITASSEPPLVTSQTTANFAFTTSDTVSTVRCQLDGAPLALCTSATTASFGGLANGPHTFTVEAIDAAGDGSAPASYTWTVAGGVTQTPAVTSISPTSGRTGGATTVTVNGANLSGATKVVFGATAATSFTVVSPTQITAVSPRHAAATVNVTVTTPGGTSASVAGDRYTYVGG
jgi:hypothetical protein